MENKNEIEIKTLIDKWALAVRNEDIAGIMANHDNDMVMFDVPFPLQSKGIEEYRKTWDLYFSWSREGVFDILEMKIIADENIGFCFGTMRCTGTNKEGLREDLIFRLTVGLKTKNGQWIICHEHHSLPSA